MAWGRTNKRRSKKRLFHLALAGKPQPVGSSSSGKNISENKTDRPQLITDLAGTGKTRKKSSKRRLRRKRKMEDGTHVPSNSNKKKH